MKRTMNRLFLRLSMLCAAVILGAVAVSQAQKGLHESQVAAEGGTEAMLGSMSTPIPAAPTALVPTSGFQENSALPQSSGDVWAAPPDDQFAQSDRDSQFSDDPPRDDYYDQAASGGQPPQPPLVAPVNEPAYDVYGESSPNDEPQELPMYQPQADDSPDFATAPVADYVEQAEVPQIAYVANEEPANEFDPPPPATNAAAPDVASAFPLEPIANDSNSEDQFGDLPPMPLAAADASPANSRDSRFSDEPPLSSPRDRGPSLDFDEDPMVESDTVMTPPPPSNPAVSPAVSNSLEPTNSLVDSSFDRGYTGSATLQVTPPTSAGPKPSGFQPPPASYQPPSPTATRSFTAKNTNDFDSNSDSESDSNGHGKPGPVELEGTQTPTLTVTKSSSPEIQVGKPAKFLVTVRNIGPVAAHEVVIRDEVPHGTRLVQTNPPASQNEGAVYWEMGTINSGSEVTATMEIIPLVEGSIGSVATVSFQAAASARSLATKPELLLEHTGPGQVLVGEDVVFHIRLSNPGSGIAHNVRLEEDVPPGLRHTDGSQLEYHVGTIRPGETRLLELTLKADQAGMVDNLLYARGDSDLETHNLCQLEVVAPSLQVGIDGPSRRYLDRRASFQLQVANPGTAPARDVQLVAHLPKGLEFVSSNNAGQYNPQDHAVYWRVAELPAKEMGTVELVTTPNAMGEQRIRVESKAQMGLTDTADHQMIVEGLAAILYNVTDLADPIEVGGQTTYEINIVNQGSKVGTNVRLTALIPDGMQPINGEGPTRVTMQGQQVVFEPLARLAPQAEASYKIHVKGLRPGDHRITVQLQSDDVSQPVTKEESTNVYADE